MADTSFSSLLFLKALRQRGLTAITRLRLDAALYDPAPSRTPGTMGRPRKAGRRLATLAKVAADAATVWQPLHVEHWYGGGARDLLIASAAAVWRHNGLPVVPMRWVLIRDPTKPDAPAQALLCTDLDRTPEEIVTLLARTLPARQRRSATAAAWYPKARPTFSDALGAVRRAIWREQHFQTSPRRTDRRKLPFRLPQAWAYALCNAA